MTNATRLIRAAAVSVAAVFAFAVLPSPALAAKPMTGTMTFGGEVTSVDKQGNLCRYTADLNVSTTMGGTPEGIVGKGRVQARWTDVCRSDEFVSGTADIRLNVSTSMSGNPEGFRARGKGSNVHTSMAGNPEGFKFQGVFVSG